MSEKAAAEPKWETLSETDKVQRLHKLLKQQAFAISDLATRLDLLENHSHHNGKMVIEHKLAKKGQQLHPILNQLL